MGTGGKQEVVFRQNVFRYTNCHPPRFPTSRSRSTYLIYTRPNCFKTFSTSAPRAADVAKVILVGRLGREPEVRTTKSDKEYVSYVLFHPSFNVLDAHSLFSYRYVVATTNYPPPAPGADGGEFTLDTSQVHL